MGDERDLARRAKPILEDGQKMLAEARKDLAGILPPEILAELDEAIESGALALNSANEIIQEDLPLPKGPIQEPRWPWFDRGSDND